jgi:hypothetical protein
VRAPVIIAAGAVVVLIGGAAYYWLQPTPAPPAAEAVRPVAPTRPSTRGTPTPDPAPPSEPARRAAPRSAPVVEAPPPPPVEAAPTTATLRIETDVPEASVFLDRVGVGTAPLTIPNVAPGSHRLNVSAAGYDSYAETIDVEPGSRTITVAFKEIRLNTSVAAQHKHGMGSCRGQLIGSPDGVRYQAADGKDSFAVTFADLTGIELDYLGKNLRLRTRQGRTYNFTEVDGNLDKIAYFQQDVEKVRKRIASR